MSHGHTRTSAAEQPYGGSFGGWFFKNFMLGLCIAAGIAVLTVHLCNKKVARDSAKRDADWAAQQAQ